MNTVFKRLMTDGLEALRNYSLFAPLTLDLGNRAIRKYGTRSLPL
jgi:hypothetical protein